MPAVACAILSVVPDVILSGSEESQRWWGGFFGHCVPSE